MSNHEERLDRYIDNLNGGQSDVPNNDDAELAGLFATVRQLHVLRESAVPLAIAAGLAGQLRTGAALTTPNRHPERSAAQSNGSLADPSTPSPRPFNSAQDDFGETSSPSKHWFRQTTQFAGAALAFTLFGLVLVLVFRDARGVSPQPGAAPPIIGQIAFAASYDGNGDIYLVNADGSGLLNLTNNPADDAVPAWSPDGSQIAFVSDRDGTEHVYVMDADGSNVTQLTAGVDRWTYPVWSPDGAKIALLRIVSEDRNEPSSQLYVMEADGSDARSLTDGETPASMFVWSPDSSEIAATIELSGRGPRVLIYRADGNGSRALTQSEQFEFMPVWSPDGARIALVETQPGDSDGVVTHSVVIVDADGTSTRNLANSLDFHSMPAWSPDGSSLAVAGNIRNESAGIYIVSADDPDDVWHLGPTANDDVFPIWSPDSQQLAFFRSSATVDDPTKEALMVINADGTGLTEVAADLQTLPMPAWRPMPSSTPVDKGTPSPTPTDTPESAEHSIDIATVVPKDPMPADPDLLTIEAGVQIVRAFIGDPDADLEGTYDDGLHGLQEIWVTQHHPGFEYSSGRYSVSRVTGNIVEATMPMNTTLHAQEDPATEAEAQAIAEEFVRNRVPDFDSLTPHESDMSAIAPGADGEDILHRVSWRQQDPDSGAWLPTWIIIEVDLETGLVYSFVIHVEDYDGPTEPAISEEQAIQITLKAADDIGVSDLSVGSAELRIIWHEVERSDDGRVLRREMRMIWEVQLDNVWNGMAGITNFQVDAMTGEVINPDVSR